MDEPGTVMLRLRMSQADAHYAGDLVDGARIMALFGDLATELLIRHDGDEGLFRAYDNVEFLAPVFAGDYVEARGRITAVGDTSRRMEFEAYKVITQVGRMEGTAGRPAPGTGGRAEAGEPASAAGPPPSSARVLDPPLLVARASGTCVVPKERQAWRR